MLGDGCDGLTFRKELIHVGDFRKRTKNHDQPFSITPAKLQHWEQTGNLMISDGVKVPCPLKHNDTPEATRAKALGYELAYNKKGKLALYGYLQFRDSEAAKLALTTDVSILVPEDPMYNAANGRKYDYSIKHIALTDYPVIPDLEGFEAVMLSLDDEEPQQPEKKSNKYAAQNAAVAKLLKDKKGNDGGVAMRTDAVERLVQKKDEKEKEAIAEEKLPIPTPAVPVSAAGDTPNKSVTFFKNSKAAQTARNMLHGIQASNDTVSTRNGHLSAAALHGAIGAVEYHHAKHIAHTTGGFVKRQFGKGGVKRLARVALRTGFRSGVRKFALPALLGAAAIHGVVHSAKGVAGQLNKARTAPVRLSFDRTKKVLRKVGHFAGTTAKSVAYGVALGASTKVGAAGVRLAKYGYRHHGLRSGHTLIPSAVVFGASAVGAHSLRKLVKHNINNGIESHKAIASGLEHVRNKVKLSTDIPANPGVVDQHGNIHGTRGRFAPKPDHLKSKNQLHRKIRSGVQFFKADKSREDHNNNQISSAGHAAKHAAFIAGGIPTAYFAGRRASSLYKQAVKEAGGGLSTGGRSTKVKNPTPKKGSEAEKTLKTKLTSFYANPRKNAAGADIPPKTARGSAANSATKNINARRAAQATFEKLRKVRIGKLGRFHNALRAVSKSKKTFALAAAAAGATALAAHQVITHAAALRAHAKDATTIKR
jgi:hypothetical protein